MVKLNTFTFSDGWEDLSVLKRTSAMVFCAVGGAAFLHFNFFFLFTDLVVQSTRKESPPSWSFHNEPKSSRTRRRDKLHCPEKNTRLFSRTRRRDKWHYKKTAFHTNIACRQETIVNMQTRKDLCKQAKLINAHYSNLGLTTRELARYEI